VTASGDAEALIPMDPFELLGLPRRPLLSEEEIGTAYRQLAATLHPDQSGGNESQFKELGEAMAILRDPARRLRSLMSPSSGTSIPPEAAELFPRVASLLREADDLLARHATASNPLAKAVLAAPLKKLSVELDSLLLTIEAWHSDLNNHLSALDAVWPEHDPEAIAALADSFSYATRWESQLRERKLAFECL
jgi:curved DNA-binding protein CbpA